MPGELFVVATPIGNLGDWSPRARDTVAGADLVLVEDTRVSQKLFAAFDLRPAVRVYEKHRERRETDKILRLLQEGKRIAILSDAGTPGISDPGGILVAEALDHGIKVSPIPGPSAIISALSVAGLADTGFTFHGYGPLKSAGWEKFFEALRADDKAHVILVSPHGAKKFFAALSASLPRRRVIVCRELTKLHEDIRAGTAEELIDSLEADEALRGEMTIVIHPSEEDAGVELAELIAEARRIHGEYGMTGKDLRDFLAFRTGVPKKLAYAAVERLHDDL